MKNKSINKNEKSIKMNSFFLFLLFLVDARLLALSFVRSFVSVDDCIFAFSRPHSLVLIGADSFLSHSYLISNAHWWKLKMHPSWTENAHTVCV